MSVIENLLSAVRLRRQEKFQTVAERYSELVTALARNEQCDVDEIAELLDSLDKSDSDLQREVEAKQRRLQAAENIGRLRKVAATIPKLAAELKRLDNELTAIIAEKKPAIATAAEKLRAAELQSDIILSEERTLQTIGIPIHVQVRQSRLATMLKEIVPMHARYESYTHNERKRLPIAQRNLEDAQSQLAKFSDDEPGNKRNAQETVDSLAREVHNLERTLQNFEPLRLEIVALQSAIDAERKLIDVELMKP